MSRKSTTKKTKVLDEILELKDKRRVDVIKCLAAIVLIIVVIMGKPLFEMMGVIPEGSVVAAGVMFFLAVVLAVFAGSASNDYAKSGRRIDELCSRNSISRDEI